MAGASSGASDASRSVPGRVCRWRPRREPEVREDAGDDLGLLDRGEDAHRSLAAGALEHLQFWVNLRAHVSENLPRWLVPRSTWEAVAAHRCLVYFRAVERYGDRFFSYR